MASSRMTSGTFGVAEDYVQEMEALAPMPTKAAQQRRAPSPTGFMRFAGRSHVIFAERGWQEVADAAIGWAMQHAR